MEIIWNKYLQGYSMVKKSLLSTIATQNALCVCVCVAVLHTLQTAKAAPCGLYIYIYICVCVCNIYIYIKEVHNLCSFSLNSAIPVAIESTSGGGVKFIRPTLQTQLTWSCQGPEHMVSRNTGYHCSRPRSGCIDGKWMETKCLEAIKNRT